MTADLHVFTEADLDPELQGIRLLNLTVDKQVEEKVVTRARLAKDNGMHLDIHPAEDGSMNVTITNHVK